jgi:hypothetical protein
MTWAEAARAGRWTDWPGLPSPLSEDTLARELGLGAGARTDTMLGRRTRVVVEAGNARYWLEGNDVILVELVEPPSELPVGELLGALGEPEREGAGRYRKLGASTTEHVYPARGLAVTEARSYDGTFEPYVAQVLLFAPTDMAGFVLERGGNDRGYPQA